MLADGPTDSFLVFCVGVLNYMCMYIQKTTGINWGDLDNCHLGCFTLTVFAAFYTVFEDCCAAQPQPVSAISYKHNE